MVRHYIRKTNQHSWSEDSMKSAILAYHNKEMGFRKAALSFGVPQTTLERRAKQFAATDNLTKASTKGSLFFIYNNIINPITKFKIWFQMFKVII